MSFDEALALLAVERTDSKETIRRAYLRKVKQYKPEVDPAGFQRLRAAYELLGQQLAWHWAQAATNTADTAPPNPDTLPAIAAPSVASPIIAAPTVATTPEQIAVQFAASLRANERDPLLPYPPPVLILNFVLDLTADGKNANALFEALQHWVEKNPTAAGFRGPWAATWRLTTQLFFATDTLRPVQSALARALRLQSTNFHWPALASLPRKTIQAAANTLSFRWPALEAMLIEIAQASGHTIKPRQRQSGLRNAPRNSYWLWTMLFIGIARVLFVFANVDGPAAPVDKSRIGDKPWLSRWADAICQQKDLETCADARMVELQVNQGSCGPAARSLKDLDEHVGRLDATRQAIIRTLARSLAQEARQRCQW